MKIVYNRGTKIKYDRMDQKLSFLIATITTALWIASFVVCCSPLLELLSTEIVVYVILTGSYFCPVVAVASWLFYWNCGSYLKRLERYGYEVPYRKRDYRGGLESLKKQKPDRRDIRQDIRQDACQDTLQDIRQDTRQDTRQHAQQDARKDTWRDVRQDDHGDENISSVSRESVSLAVISWVISAGFILCFIPFWGLYPDMAGCFVFFAGLALCWMIAGAHYFRQRLRTKYKDDVEPEIELADESSDTPDEKSNRSSKTKRRKTRIRKTRTHFTEGIIAIVVCLVLSIVLMGIFFSFAGVVHKARMGI